MSINDHRQGRIVDMVVAELGVLRAEMAQKRTAQVAILGLNLTATTTTLGLVISQKIDIRVLILLPILTSSLGILTLVQSMDIRTIARYINEVLRPITLDYLGDERVLFFECYYRQARQLRYLGALSSGALFPLLSTGALILVAPHVGSLLEWFTWALGVGLVVTQVLAWTTRFVTPKWVGPEAMNPSGRPRTEFRAPTRD